MLKQEQLQRDHELLKMANAPKWTSIDPLHRHWKKTLWPTMNQPIPGVVDSEQWIVDSRQWREMGNGGKQTWKRVRGREQEDLSPPLHNPAPSPYFLAHFSLRFPNQLKACYRLTTSFIYKCLWAPWALIKFLDLEGGRLFEVDACQRLGAN